MELFISGVCFPEKKLVDRINTGGCLQGDQENFLFLQSQENRFWENRNFSPHQKTPEKTPGKTPEKTLEINKNTRKTLEKTPDSGVFSSVFSGVFWCFFRKSVKSEL